MRAEGLGYKVRVHRMVQPSWAMSRVGRPGSVCGQVEGRERGGGLAGMHKWSKERGERGCIGRGWRGAEGGTT